MAVISLNFVILFLIFNFINLNYGHVRFDRRTSHMDHFLKDWHKESKEHATHHKIQTKAPKITGCSSCPSDGPKTSKCVPKIQCPAYIRKSKDKNIMCHLPGNRLGVCCSTGFDHFDTSNFHPRSDNSAMKKDISLANKKSKIHIQRLVEIENELLSATKFRATVSPHTPSFGHFQSSRSTEHEKLCPIALGALQNLFATQNLLEKEAITSDDVELGIARSSTAEGTFCPPRPFCTQAETIYRTIDGSCNNLLHPLWGTARSPYSRVLPPDYSDGTWSYRTSVTGADLPSPRLVSSVMMPDRNRLSKSLNLLTMQFGQFITHDITNAVSFTFQNGSGISCCKENGVSAMPQEFSHFGCQPIMIGDDDFFGSYGQKCMNFVRTQLAPSDDCTLGYANQMNGVSHYLDLTTLYGVSNEGSSTFRENVGGRLKIFKDFGRELPQLSTNPDDCMSSMGACFKSGDGHVNQMISLVAVHMLWSRQHNHIADVLAKLNPHWNDETIFQEARKISIALYQHIIYYEWLPLIIGEEAVDAFSLHSKVEGIYSLDYNPTINPSITNEFATAAFRFGHSTVEGFLRLQKQGRPYETISIPEVMFQPSRMRLREFYDRILHCLTDQPMQHADASMSHSLTRYLFHGGEPFGLDLAAINVQRGRDHGLKSYHHYRTLIDLPENLSFKEFGTAAHDLMSVYDSPHDIDLWIGGLLEQASPGAAVGPTFVELIADQFSRLRKGDRFFYEHAGVGQFTLAQLSEIKKFTMARLICDYSDGIELLGQQRNAFVRPDYPGNDWIPCDSSEIPKINLAAWREF